MCVCVSEREREREREGEEWETIAEQTADRQIDFC